MSPESPEPDAQEYNLTPRTEAKYAKIDEDFQMLIRNQQHNGSRATMGQSNYSLPVSVPVNTYGHEQMLGSSPQMPHPSISPRPSSSETDSGRLTAPFFKDIVRSINTLINAMIYLLTVYPPGGMLEMSNGYPPSASPLGGSPSPGPSPALSKANQSRHSPQPPPPPHPHRGNLRVVIPTPLAQSLAEEAGYDVSSVSCPRHL